MGAALPRHPAAASRWVQQPGVSGGNVEPVTGRGGGQIPGPG